MEQLKPTKGGSPKVARHVNPLPSTQANHRQTGMATKHCSVKPKSCRNKVLSSSRNFISFSEGTSKFAVLALSLWWSIRWLNKVERWSLTPWRGRLMPAGAASTQEHVHGLWLEGQHKTLSWTVTHFPGSLPLEIQVTAALRNRYFCFCTRQIPTLKWETPTKSHSGYC